MNKESLSVVLACFFIPIILTVVCAIAIIAVGLAILMPFNETSHFSTSPATCTANGTEYVGIIDCDCSTRMDDFCKSTYPCARVTVFYESRVTSEQLIAPLYYQPRFYSTLKKKWCSASVCGGGKTENAEFVHAFVSQYGVPNQTFPCYIGGDENPEALISLFERWQYLLGMLLPGCILIVCIIVLIIYKFVIFK